MTTSHASLSNLSRGGILLLLALVMLATRINHFSALPDASWAVFFAGGFYLGKQWRVAFPLLIALGVGIDYAVISGQGLNFWQHYCISPAYGFLQLAYALMWLGGVWFARRYGGLDLRSLGFLAASLFLATTACYLLSNGSFYWLSPSVAAPTFAGWLANLGHWYLPYLKTSFLYVGIGALLHAATLLAVRQLGDGATDPALR